MNADISKTADEIRARLEAEEQEQVKIAVFGQPGAGKSSLINSLLGDMSSCTGVGNDTTTQADLYIYNGIIMADLPGYDTAKFPAQDYLQRFDLLDYDAFLFVFNGKFHAADVLLFAEVSNVNNACLLVRTGLDSIFDRNKTIETLKQEIVQDVCVQLGQQLAVQFVSNRSGAGLEQLITALETMLPTAKRERFIRSVKAHTQQIIAEKYLVCEKLVAKYAWLAAANAVNPIPGLDVSIDLKLMNKMFDEIKSAYGLDEAKLDKFRGVLPMAERVLKMGTKEGMSVIMKKYIGKQGVEGLAKYIPYAGQAVAISIGYVLTSNLGKRYLDDCRELAAAILEEKLHKM